MKILLLTAGDSIHAVRWANAFAVRNHEVHFVTLADHKERGDSFSNKVIMHYLPHGGSLGYIKNAGSLSKLFKQIDPDVVNVHYASGYGTLMRIARLKNTVLSVWGSDVYDFPERNFLTRHIVIKNLKYADRLASTSNVMAKQVRKLLHDEEKQIAITPFGVDITRFTPEGDRELEDDFFWFGLVKKLTYKYGIDFIINAFSIFYKRWKNDGAIGKEPRLFICGKGENKKDFEKLVEEKGLNNSVIIRGYIPNEKIPSLLRSFDVFCLGSQLNSESFGVSAVEAMSCGIPVIATDVDGFREVVDESITGYIVNKADVSGMASLMYDLYHDDNKRNELGENGRRRVVDLYNWEDNVKSLEEVLLSVANRR